MIDHFVENIEDVRRVEYLRARSFESVQKNFRRHFKRALPKNIHSMKRCFQKVLTSETYIALHTLEGRCKSFVGSPKYLPNFGNVLQACCTHGGCCLPSFYEGCQDMDTINCTWVISSVMPSAICLSGSLLSMLDPLLSKTGSHKGLVTRVVSFGSGV